MAVSRPSWDLEWRSVVAAVLVLSLGALVYVLDRPAASAAFFVAVNVSHLVPPVFGQIGGSLPAFAHAFAFSILTAGLTDRTRVAAGAACLGWLLVDVAFEVGQYPAVAATLARAIPPELESWPIVGRTGGYFVAGTFDWRDLLAIVLGALAAYAFARWPTRREPVHA